MKQKDKRKKLRFIVSKKEGFFLFGIFTLFVLYLIFIFQKTKYIYFWDYTTYWDYSIEMVGALFSGIFWYLKNVVYSILYFDYSYLPSIIPTFVMRFFGKTRLVYTLAITIFYLFPWYLFTYLILRRKKKENQNMILALFGIFLPLLPYLFYLINLGFVDVGGLAIIALIVWLLRREKNKKRNYILSGLLFMTLYFFRRWYMFFVVSFLICNFIKDLVPIKKTKKNILEIIKKYLFIGVPMLVVVFVCFLLHAFYFHEDVHNFFLYKLLFVNYSEVYQAYKFNTIEDFKLLLQSFGLFPLLLAFLSIVYANRKKKNQIEVNTWAFQFLLCFLLFTKTQSHSIHHLLLYVPALTFLIFYLFQNLERTKGKILCYGLLTLQFLCLLYPISSTPVTNFLIKNNMISNLKMQPLKTKNVDEIGKLVKILDQYSENGEKMIYINSSSVLFNESIAKNYDKSIHNKFERKSYYMEPCHIDERDGYPVQMEHADIVLVTNPSQYHLDKKHQKIVTYVNKTFYKNKTIAKFYTKVKEMKIKDVTFTIYKKKKIENEKEFQKEFSNFIEDAKKSLEKT